VESTGNRDALGRAPQREITDHLRSSAKSSTSTEVEEDCLDGPETLASDTTSENPQVSQAVTEAQAGDLGPARQRLEAHLAQNPDCLVALNWLAAVLRTQNEHPTALAICARISQIAPHDPESQNNVGLCNLAAGHFEDAAGCFATAERLDPSNVNYVLNGAIAHRHRNCMVEAEKAFRRGVARFPNDPTLNAGLGELLFEQEDIKSSIPYLRVAVAFDPSCSRYKVALAQALTLSDDFDVAEALAREVVALDPGCSRAHAVIGSILQHRGDFEGAGLFLRRAIELEPELTGAYFEHVYGSRVTHEDEAMLAKMDEFLSAPELPDHDRLCLNYALGKAYDDLGDFATAIGYFEEANRVALKTRRKNREFHPGKMAKEIDERIDRFDDQFIAAHRRSGLEEITPVFIVGMMRSGSTLVEQVLSSHPLIEAGGELLFWPDNVLEIEGREGIDFEKARTLAEQYLGILEKIGPNAVRVTDKMTDNVLHIGILATLFPQARFICCRRHPVGACLSLFTTPFRYSQPYLHDKQDIASAYRQYARLMDHWKRVMPEDRFLEVWYKDLVTNTEAVSRRMIDFVGLDWDDACLRHEENPRIITTASKWQARQPVYDNSLERWHHYTPWIGPFTALLEELEEAA